MPIIPIFIYIHEKSDKELREEMEREARWNKLIEEDERRRRERERQEKLRKEEEKRKKQEEIEAEYRRMERENPWDFMILPEGWSIFGQTNIQVLPFE